MRASYRPYPLLPASVFHYHPPLPPLPTITAPAHPFCRRPQYFSDFFPLRSSVDVMPMTMHFQLKPESQVVTPTALEAEAPDDGSVLLSTSSTSNTGKGILTNVFKSVNSRLIVMQVMPLAIMEGLTKFVEDVMMWLFVWVSQILAPWSIYVMLIFTLPGGGRCFGQRPTDFRLRNVGFARQLSPCLWSHQRQFRFLK